MADSQRYRLVIGLPAFNEEQNLPDLLRDIQAVGLDDCLILVVDDGSSDRTAAVVREWSGHPSAALIQHPLNQGLGAALHTIITNALSYLRADGFLVTMDADGTHRPQQIPKLLQTGAQGFDLVVASRYVGSGKITGVPWYRRVLSVGAYVVVRSLFGVRQVRDVSSGYRAISTKLLRQALAQYPEGLATERGFVATVEVLVKLLRSGARPAETGLDLRYDLKKGASKMKIWRTVRDYFRLRSKL